MCLFKTPATLLSTHAVREKTPQHATDVFTVSKTNLTGLDDVVAHHVVHVAAGVVPCIPLAAPRTGHT